MWNKKSLWQTSFIHADFMPDFRKLWHTFEPSRVPRTDYSLALCERELGLNRERR
jgi:hypothetical protein